MIERLQITGVVLSGGRGSRMGGVDKGLQDFRGMPLAQHALKRLAPQVGPLLINANRNRAQYEKLGAVVCEDTLPDYPGPLAGVLAGLERCATPWLVSVPCDSPVFPLDLVQRLAAAADAAQAEIAMPVTTEGGVRRAQPVFCLLRASLAPRLAMFMRSGQRKVEHWVARHGCIEVEFEEGGAFANANTLSDLQRLAVDD